jgi:hypothetical protein
LDGDATGFALDLVTLEKLLSAGADTFVVTVVSTCVAVVVVGMATASVVVVAGI